MKYAIVKIGSSQHKVAEGEELFIDKITTEKDQPVKIDQVLLVADNGQVSVGQPLVAGITVTARVVDQVKGKKIRVATYKAKSRYRRVIGHRQHLTKIMIESIGGNKETKKSSAKTDTKPETPKPSQILPKGKIGKATEKTPTKTIKAPKKPSKSSLKPAKN